MKKVIKLAKEMFAALVALRAVDVEAAQYKYRK